MKITGTKGEIHSKNELKQKVIEGSVLNFKVDHLVYKLGPDDYNKDLDSLKQTIVDKLNQAGFRLMKGVNEDTLSNIEGELYIGGELEGIIRGNTSIMKSDIKRYYEVKDYIDRIGDRDQEFVNLKYDIEDAREKARIKEEASAWDD